MYHVSTLKNGITLITVPIKGTKATTVLAMFPVGSRYEDPRILGCSHFVEHLMFKGTVKRPTTLDISRALDSYGSQYNAFTSKEYTGYYIKIAGNKQAVAYDILSDMLYNSQFMKEEVEKEKGAIVEELRMYKDNPLMDIENIFESLLFGDTPLGREIGGSEKTVRGVTREELWEYYQKHYSPKNMVVVVAGEVDRKKIKSVLPKHFEVKEPPKGAFGLKYYKKDFEKIDYFKKKLPIADRVYVKEKKVDQSQIMLGFPGLAYNSKQEDVLDVLSTIFGGAMSSRLFIEVRERRGLAYMIRSGGTFFRDTGAVYVQAGLDPVRMPEAIRVIKEQIQKMKDEKVTEKELEDAKNNIAGGIALTMEDSHNQANWFAEEFIFANKIETQEEKIKKIRKVTAEQIQKLAQELFDFDQMRIAAISPITKEKLVAMLK